jgi:hypothetical protein
VPARFAIDNGRTLAWLLIADRPHVYLTEPGCDWCHARLGARGQSRLGLGQALINLLAGKLDVDLVVEDGGYLREAIARKRPCVFKPRNAGKRGLKRISDLLFDIGGRERRRGRTDLYLPVGDVWHSVDWELRQRPGAKGGSDNGQQRDEPALVHRKRKDAQNHDDYFRC